MIKRNKRYTKRVSRTYKPINKIPRIRGGWSTSNPPRSVGKLGKHAMEALLREYTAQVGRALSPQQFHMLVGALLDKAISGKSERAATFLKTMAEPLEPMVRGEILKLITPTLGGVSGPPNIQIPSFSSDGVKRISGKNSLYTAKEYRQSFRAGNSSGRWMRELAKTNSITKEIISDTQSDYMLDSAGRGSLTRVTGSNRKSQMIIDPALFGETIAFPNSLFTLSGMDTTLAVSQTLYGAISSITSKMSLTSLNRYIPMYVRLSLLRNKVSVNTPAQSFADCYNDVFTVQDNGAMPSYYQNTSPLLSSGFWSEVTVDPKTPGVKSADNWKNNFDVVYSKKTKLYAGDRVKFDYKHLFGSGINLSKVYGMVKETDDFASGTQITYSLMIEAWGEEVDILSVATNQVIKATAPVSFQLEFKKEFTAAQRDLTIDDRATRGFESSKYAVKAYTKRLVDATARRWNDSHGNLGVNYIVPVMSDATEQEGGRIS